MAESGEGYTEHEVLEASGRASVPLCARMSDILSPETVPVAVPRSRQTAEVREALDHYFRCGNCRNVGLTSFLDKEMACETALLTLARDLGRFFLYLENHESLEVVLASDHVLGYWDGNSLLRFRYCTAAPCVAFQQFWFDPIGANRDSRARTAHKLVALYQIFREARFGGIAEIRRLMRARVAALVARMGSKQFTDEGFAFIKMEMDAICNVMLA